MPNVFQPPNMNQNSNNNTNFMNLMNNPIDATMANPSLNRTSTVSGSNFLDNRPITPFAGEQSHGKSQRSNLNPNAPDFSSRSNSFSTNTISQHQQPLLNLGNNLNPGSFNNLSQMPARNNFGNAPRISQDVRQMIVIHSMNLFQNQVPKRHQEAAARLAHLSAQSNSFVNNDMHNVFNPTAANQQINDKLSYLQYLRAANNGGVNNTNAADSYQIQAMLSQLQQPNSASSRLTTGSGSGSVSSTSASPVHSSTFSLSNYDSVSANAFVPTQSNSVIETLVEDNGTNSSNVQKIKQPAPIGTERAQKKNPNPGYPTLSSTVAEPLACFNPNNTVNANSLFDNNSIPWRLDNEEITVPSESSADLTNTHLTFGSSLGNSELMNDFFSAENSLSGLFNQLAGNGGGSNQQPAQRTASNQQSTRFNPIGDDFDYNTTSFNTSKPLFMQANNFLNPTINTSDPVVPDPAEYWHSSTSAVPKTSKTDPFDPKMQWNNWNNNLN